MLKQDKNKVYKLNLWLNEVRDYAKEKSVSFREAIKEVQPKKVESKTPKSPISSPISPTSPTPRLVRTKSSSKLIKPIKKGQRKASKKVAVKKAKKKMSRKFQTLKKVKK